jgi:spermidine/putrescine transport system ATP-binding protein
VPADVLNGATGDVRIGVRPEKVRVLPQSDPPEPDANRLAGTVRDVSYIGVSTQYVIDTPTGEELVAIAQNTGRGARHLSSGEAVQVLWDPQHTFVITDAGHVPTVEELL